MEFLIGLSVGMHLGHVVAEWMEKLFKATGILSVEIDPVLLFIDERLSNAMNRSTPLKGIYSVYKDWCEDYGYKQASATSLRKSIEKKLKVEGRRQNRGIYLPGVIVHGD